jgi:hypothetical protein
MKFIKKVLVFLIVLVLLGLLIALFVPKSYDVERSVVIQKDVQEVFDFVKYVKNQDLYGVWQLSDPDMKTTATGEDGTPGFKYEWDSKKLGKGSQSIVAVAAPDSIITALDFGFGNPAKSVIKTESVGENSTKVTWGMYGKTPYPLNFVHLFYDSGKDFEAGLANLKRILEK